MADKKISALTAATTPLAGTEVLPIVQSGATVKVAVSDLTAGRAVAAKSVTGDALTDATVANWNSNNGTYGLDIGYLYNNSRIGSTGSAKGIDGTRALTDFGLHGINNLEFFTGYTYRGKWDSTGNFVIGTAAKGVNFTANTPAAGMTSQLLNWYEEGTWTPTDASGAGLTFNTASGYYTRVGRLVTVFFTVEYPSTANATAARIGGLPFTALNDALSPSGGSFHVNTSASTTAVPAAVQNTTQLLASNPATGGSFTNAQLSTGYLRGFVTYMV